MEMRPEVFVMEEEKREIICYNLNFLLATLLTLHLKIKSAHWNITGPHFRDLHLMLDEHAANVLETCDFVAERISTIGGMPLTSCGEILEKSYVHDFPSERLYETDLLSELFRDTNTIIVCLRKYIECLEQLGDYGSVNVLSDHLNMHEKFGWFLAEDLQVGLNVPQVPTGRL